jgi:16S rRNA (guanine1516-N2)-methyltransferase
MASEQTPAISIEDNGQRAHQLALESGLALAEPGRRYQLLLRYAGDVLELVCPSTADRQASVRVDFNDGRTSFRRRQQKREMLVRAVGMKTGVPLTVLDGTAGLGRDSFILASAGCRVQAIERQVIIFSLFADGLRRALSHPLTATAARRIRLSLGDTMERLQKMVKNHEQVDVVYLDPMFPQRRKSALVKKELQFLQMLAGKDSSAQHLLALALTTAGKRVVVKRPSRAPALTDLAPSHSLPGKTIRFDVYMVPCRHP